MKESREWLYGQHAVQAALQAGRRPIYEVWGIKEQPVPAGVKFRLVTRQELDAKFPNATHQGLAAQVGPLPKVGLADMAGASLLLALDQITDPHNLGALLRSADAFGCGGVLVPTARAAPLTEVVAKAACGALERVPVVEANLAQALDKLKAQGYWVIGLDGKGHTTLAEAPAYDKTVLVLGSEGAGLRQLVRKKCDHLVRLPMLGQVESLNVSVAGGIALYEQAIKRQQGGQT
jgi:23S rRNA (guanosine2251-2'-O)-methyltransferase